MDANDRKLQQEDLDRWLDLALRARADAEPRVGLENRVLARLAAEPQRKAFLWWPVLAGVAAVFVISLALTVSFSGNHNSGKTIAGSPQPASSQGASGQLTAQGGSGIREGLSVQSRLGSTPDEGVRRSALRGSARVQRAFHSGMSASARVERLPKLATFPAARPETAEERMLARLAARRDSFDMANTSGDVAPLKDLSVTELKIEPLEGTPVDNTPQE